VKTDEILDIFSTPSNSPYLGENLSPHRQFTLLPKLPLRKTIIVEASASLSKRKQKLPKLVQLFHSELESSE